MTAVAKIETILVQLPTRRTHKWTGLNEPIGRYLLVKMTGTDGTVGWGEAPALKDWGGEFGRYFGESTAVVDLIIHRYLAPAVEGLSIGRPAELHRKMDAVVKGYPYGKAAIDFAYYDLSGKVLGLPVHALLGGLLRENVAVTHSIGLLEIEEAVAEVRKVAQDGIRTIKIKIGVDVSPRHRDCEGNSRSRRAGHKTMRRRQRRLQNARTGDPGHQSRWRGIGLIYVEQPVMGIERIARVAQAIDPPVMADESAWNAHDVIQIIEQKAAQIVSIYTTKPGGLYRAMQVSAVCEAAGIICNVNGSVETGVGNLANVHLAAAAPAAVLSNVIPVSMAAEHQNGRVGGIYYKDDLLAEPMEFVDGGIRVPTAPGMGLRINEEKIERYAVKT